MNALIIGLYGVYLISAGFSGTAGEVGERFKEDAGGFIPWAIAITFLAVLSENDNTEQLVKPFAFLFLLNFVLRNFGTIESEAKKIYSMAGF